MLKAIAMAWLKTQVEDRLKKALKGKDPRTVPHGTEIPAETGFDVVAFGRDIDVRLVFVINDRKPKR